MNTGVYRILNFLDLTNNIVLSKIYDNRDYFNFEIVNFPFLDGDVPRPLSLPTVYISRLIRFASNRNRFLTTKTRLSISSTSYSIF